MKRLILVVAAIIFIVVACDFYEEHAPSPDIEILKLSPLARGVFQGMEEIVIDEVIFVARNSVDGIVNSFYCEYYTSEGDREVAPRSDPISVHFKIRGLIDTVSPAETTYVYDLPIPIGPAVDYMFSPDGRNIYVKLYMTITDAYGHGKIDTTWAKFGLFRTTAFLSLEAENTEVDVGQATKLTATILTLAGDPVPNNLITFATDLGELSSYSELTGVDGTAVTYFKSDTAGEATVTATHQILGTKSVWITVKDTTAIK